MKNSPKIHFTPAGNICEIILNHISLIPEGFHDKSDE